MGNIILAIGIIVLFVIAICKTSDFLSPACLVCESFALAFLCAIASSNAVGWKFDIHGTTCSLLITSLICFVFGSALVNVKSKSTGESYKSAVASFVYANYSMRALSVMFLIQIAMFVIYLYYYRKTLGQFSGLVGSEILRARRFVPYSMLNSARFEIMTLIIAALVMWYICYRRFSTEIGKKTQNMRKVLVRVFL